MIRDARAQPDGDRHPGLGGSPESVDALKREVTGAPTEVRMVAPAVEINPLHHTRGDERG